MTEEKEKVIPSLNFLAAFVGALVVFVLCDWLLLLIDAIYLTFTDGTSHLALVHIVAGCIALPTWIVCYKLEQPYHWMMKKAAQDVPDGEDGCDCPDL